MSSELPVACAIARQTMETATVEPGGLGRLLVAMHPDEVAASVAAGRPAEDRADGAAPGPDDAAVAAHVSACADCAAELSRLRAIAALLGDAIPATPPAELRERTLAYVRDVGRDRSAISAPVSTGPAPAAAPLPIAIPVAFPVRAPRRMPVLVRSLALAAAFILAVGGTALVVGSIARSDLEAERARNAALVATAESALRLLADPTAIHIPMQDGPGSAAGMAVVAPGTYDATVVAVGLPEPPAGQEYACYIVLDGRRVLVGRMEDGGSAYAWAGTIDALATAAPGSVGGYGVLLVPVGSTSTEGTPVLSGSL